MNKNFKFLFAVLAFMFSFSAIAFGQGTTGAIEGTVVDANGAAVPNATVVIVSTGTTAGFNPDYALEEFYCNKFKLNNCSTRFV